MAPEVSAGPLRRHGGDQTGRLLTEVLPRFEGTLHAQLLQRPLSGLELRAVLRALRVWSEAPLPRVQPLLEERVEAWLAHPGSPPDVVLGPLMDMLWELSARARHLRPPYRAFQAASAWLGAVDWERLDVANYEREAGKRAGKILHTYALGGQWPPRRPLPPPAAVVGLAALAGSGAAVANTPLDMAVQLLADIGELTQHLAEAYEAELHGSGAQAAASAPAAGDRSGGVARGPGMHGDADGVTAAGSSSLGNHGMAAESSGEDGPELGTPGVAAAGVGERADAGRRAAEGRPTLGRLGMGAPGSGEHAPASQRKPNPVRRTIAGGLAGKLDALVQRALQAMRGGADGARRDAARAGVLYRVAGALRRLHYFPGDATAAALAACIPPLAPHLCDKGVRAASELLRAWALHRHRQPDREVLDALAARFADLRQRGRWNVSRAGWVFYFLGQPRARGGPRQSCSKFGRFI